jgi:hypothetical protein
MRFFAGNLAGSARHNTTGDFTQISVVLVDATAVVLG